MHFLILPCSVRSQRPRDLPIALTGPVTTLGRSFRLGSRLLLMRVPTLRTAWFGLALSLLAPLLPGIAAAAIPAPASADDSSVLVLGRISDDPKAHYEQLKPLLDYVVPRMRDVGIKEGRILMARDAQQMTSYLRRGRVDWVTETAGTGMQLQKRAGAKPLLLTERGGVSRYHSVFFVRKDSGIDTLADLQGHSIAFQSTASTSAYIVPAATLAGPGTEPGNTALADGPADAGIGGLRVRALRTQHRRLGAQAPGRCRSVQQPGLGRRTAHAAGVPPGHEGDLPDLGLSACAGDGARQPGSDGSRRGCAKFCCRRPKTRMRARR